jgi:hypothetical protein
MVGVYSVGNSIMDPCAFGREQPRYWNEDCQYEQPDKFDRALKHSKHAEQEQENTELLP